MQAVLVKCRYIGTNNRYRIVLINIFIKHDVLKDSGGHDDDGACLPSFWFGPGHRDSRLCSRPHAGKSS